MKQHSNTTMKNSLKIFFILLFLLFKSTIILFAQDAKMTATISKNPVAAGEQFQITFSLNTSGKTFQAPTFPNTFNVLSGPNQSTSMQFINGSMSQSVSFSYILQATKEGKYTVAPAMIDVGGKRILSNTLTVEVAKGNPPQQSSGGGNRNNQSSSNNTDINQQIGKNLFLKANVSKKNVLQGEAITVTYKLYTRVSLVNYGMNKMPALNGFWSQDVSLAKQLDFHQENLDGVNYNVAEIKKVILFPQHAGTLEIDPMEGECIVRVQVQRKRSNDIFDQFFNDPFFGMGAQDVNYKIKSDAIKITVRDLPKNAPDGFSGAVGKFSMEAFIDKPETKANEAVNLKIKISGSGNIKLIENPKLSFPPDVESYDPKIADNISATANGVSGSRTFEYLLIPRHAREYKMEPFAFSYFDLEKKEYITLHSPEFKLKVAKGNEIAASSAITGVNKEDLKLLGKDIRFIKTANIKLKKKGEQFFGSATFYALLFSPFFLLVIFIIVYQRNKELQGNLMLMKSRKATKVAKKRLSAAKIFLAENKKENFYDEIFKALWGYLADKLGIAVSGLSKETASTALTQKNVNEQLIKDILATLDHCEFARFAPGGTGEMQTMYDSTMGLIAKLEQEIK